MSYVPDGRVAWIIGACERCLGIDPGQIKFCVFTVVRGRKDRSTPSSRIVEIVGSNRRGTSPRTPIMGLRTNTAGLSRDQWLGEWGSTIILQSSNPCRRMSEVGLGCVKNEI